MSKFSRQHYDVIATVLRDAADWLRNEAQEQYAVGFEEAEAYEAGGWDVLREIQRDLLDILGNDNPNFDKVKFVLAGLGNALLTGDDDIDRVLLQKGLEKNIAEGRVDPSKIPTPAAINAEGEAIRRRRSFYVVTDTD